MITRKTFRKLTPVSLAVLALTLSLSAAAQSPDVDPESLPAIRDAELRAQTEQIETIKIVLVGDSTTSNKNGWGGAFCDDHVSNRIVCANLARGGRSSFSFRAEGSWMNALAEASVKGYRDTYILIQFGHNDQPGKPGRSTDRETEFIPNIRTYVSEARSVGATPVLLTPLTRRMMENGELSDTLGPWVDAVRAIAAEMNVPLIDLYADSRAWIAKHGIEASMNLAMVPPTPAFLDAALSGTTSEDPEGKIVTELPDFPAPYEALGKIGYSFDYTHLGVHGASVTSNIVALGLARAVPDLQPDLYANPFDD